MTSENFSRFHFTLSAQPLSDTGTGTGKWASYLEIRLRDDEKGHGDIIFPRQRISEDDVFDSEEAAISEARRFAVAHVSSGEF